MIKRVLDIILSFTGLFYQAFLVVTIFLIWKSDKKIHFMLQKEWAKIINYSKWLN